MNALDAGKPEVDALLVLRLSRSFDAATGVAASDPRVTLRKLYAPAWKPWTPVEAVDKTMGAVSERA